MKYNLIPTVVNYNFNKLRCVREAYFLLFPFLVSKCTLDINRHCDEQRTLELINHRQTKYPKHHCNQQKNTDHLAHPFYATDKQDKYTQIQLADSFI